MECLKLKDERISSSAISLPLALSMCFTLKLSSTFSFQCNHHRTTTEWVWRHVFVMVSLIPQLQHNSWPTSTNPANHNIYIESLQGHSVVVLWCFWSEHTLSFGQLGHWTTKEWGNSPGVMHIHSIFLQLRMMDYRQTVLWTWAKVLPCALLWQFRWDLCQTDDRRWLIFWSWLLPVCYCLAKELLPDLKTKELLPDLRVAYCLSVRAWLSCPACEIALVIGSELTICVLPGSMV